jgi:hypothetical protein
MAITYKSQGSGVSTETSGAALSPLCPATVDANDILIGHVFWEGTTTAPSTPANWTLLSGPHVIETTIARHWVFGKIADGTEDGAAVAFGAPAVTTQRGARIYSFAGYVAGTIEDVVRGFAHTSHATDPAAPDVTTTQAGALAVLLVGQNDNNTFGSFTGETGGNYTEATAEFSANLTPGFSMGIQTATPTSDPGTITGGGDATTNDPVGVIGFEIRPRGENITPPVASLAADGISGLMSLGITVLAGALALTGIAPEISQASNTSITPTTGAITISGNQAEFDLGMYFTGNAPTVVLGTPLTPTAGSVAFTGSDPSLLLGTVIPPAAGSLTLSGNAPEFPGATTITGSVGSLVLSGLAPTLTEGSSGTNTNLTPLTGGLFFGDANEPSTASLGLTGYAPDVLTPRYPGTAQALTLAGQAPTVSVSIGKSWYLANATSGGWRTVSESFQAAATINDGWVVATGAVNHSAYAAGVERAATTFLNAVPPNGTLDTSLFDAFRTENPYLGTFASGNWEVHFVVRAVTSATGQDGRIRFRLMKGSADGISFTEITSGHQACSLLTDVSTGDNDSSLIFNPGAFAVTNEYLFLQLAWERTGGATMANADINWRTGSALTTGTRIASASFADGATSVTVTPTGTSLTFAGIAPGVSESSGSLPVTITPSTGELFFGDVQSLTPQSGSLIFTGYAPLGSPSPQIQPPAGTLTLEGQNAGFNQAILTPGTATLKVQQWAQISWTANTEPDLAGYIVRQGTTSGTYPNSRNVNNVLTYVWEGLPYGNNYFVVDAYDTSNNISLHSSEVSTFISGGGWAPTAERGTPVTPAVTSLAVTGAAPTPVEAAPPSLALSPLTGVLTITGVEPATAFTITPDVSALALSGVAPTVTSGNSPLVTPLKGTLAFTGIAPTVFLEQAQLITPSVATLSLSGGASTLAHVITPPVGSLDFTQTNKEPVIGIGLIPETFDLFVVPRPGLLDFAIATGTGSLTVAGNASLLSFTIQPSVGALVIDSDQPIVQVPGNTSIAPFRGSLTLTGDIPTSGVTITPLTTPLEFETFSPAPPNISITPSTGTLVIGPANAGAITRVRVTPLPCYPRWSRSNTWGGHSWCAHRRIVPYRTDQLNALAYYLQVDIEQSSASDFVIAQITPILNINAQLPDKYQAFVDEDGFERLSVEIVSGSSDDFVIQSIRPVMNLKKQRRHS